MDDERIEWYVEKWGYGRKTDTHNGLDNEKQIGSTKIWLRVKNAERVANDERGVADWIGEYRDGPKWLLKVNENIK